MLSLNSVVNDAELLDAFHAFTARYHAQEALLFWLEIEVYRNRNWKAAKFFGLTPPATPSSSGASASRRSFTSSFTSRQHRLDVAEARRMGVSLDQLFLVKEADFVYDTFVSREGELWTCLDAATVQQIERELFHGDAARVSRTLYDAAQNRVFNEINNDLMPRFCRELDGDGGGVSAKARSKYEELKRDAAQPAAERRRTQVATALAFSFAKRASLGGKANKAKLTKEAAAHAATTSTPTTSAMSTRKSLSAAKLLLLVRTNTEEEEEKEDDEEAAAPRRASLKHKQLTTDAIKEMGLSKVRRRKLGSAVDTTAVVKRASLASPADAAPVTGGRRRAHSLHAAVTAYQPQQHPNNNIVSKPRAGSAHQ